MSVSKGRVVAVLAGLAMSLAISQASIAAPASPELQAQLMALFNRWEHSLGDGKLADAAAISVPDLRKQIIDATKSKEDAEGLAAMAKSMTPDTLEPRRASLSKDGKHAVIVALATVKMPENLKLPKDAPPDAPKPGQIIHNEITLKFEREGNEWKFAEQIFGMDPGQIKTCHDEAAETIAAYDKGRSQSAGGPISRVEFKQDHTLVVFRVVDEENCAILPPKAKLTNPAALEPYAIVSLDGFPHKTDKQRMWAETYKIVAEDQ
ncbi:MAG TPA: hypothetical protein VID77_01300 [Stellaceae bacterium]|jgi:hypothetical protein